MHLCSLVVAPSLISRIVSAQVKDPKLASKLEDLIDNMLDEYPSEWHVSKDGGLRFRGRLCVPDNPEIRREVLYEAHCYKFTIRPGGVKMYQDVKRSFWWECIKRDVADYVSKCLTCQQVKEQHLRPGGLYQSLEVSMWKWEHIFMDFVDSFLRLRRGNESIWVIVYRLTKVAHFLPVPAKRKSRMLASLYVNEIVKLHGVPVTIV